MKTASAPGMFAEIQLGCLPPYAEPGQIGHWRKTTNRHGACIDFMQFEDPRGETT